MKYRLGKVSDAKRIAEIQKKIKEVNSLGIFCMMGKKFLSNYYKILIEDPSTVFLCAENEDGKIIGYVFNSLDVKKENENMQKNKLKLIFSAITSIISNPKLLKELYRRYNSLNKNDEIYLHTEGAHGGYWGWDPEYKDSTASLILHELGLKLTQLLGAKTIHFEVDIANKNVYKFHKLNGAKIEKVFTLPDGRERAFLSYNLNNHKFKL